jgi:hypothetical protein
VVKRLFAGFWAGVYFLANVPLAHSAEGNFWAERRRAKAAPAQVAFAPGTFPLLNQLPAVTRQAVTPHLSATVTQSLPRGWIAKHKKLFQALPGNLGTIRKISLPPRPRPDGPVVLHIQDVHQNQEAQRNIALTIKSLVDSGQAGAIALEGAFEPIDLKRFRAFEDREVVRKVADYLLRENKITGPIHTAMTGPVEFPPVVGVDDRVHYEANVEAYKQSAPRLEEYRKKIQAVQADVENQKQRLYNPALLVFDRAVESYRQGRTGLGNYVKAILPPPLRGRVGVGGETAVDLFLEALKLEETLDFKRVEQERRRIIEQLTPRLTKAQTDELLQTSVAYRMGRISYAGFYEKLKDLCRRHGIALSQYPAMEGYIRYVLLADSVDAEALYGELNRLENEGYARLAATDGERLLVERSRQAHLTAKLIDFSLTPEEWKEYSEMVFLRPAQSQPLDLRSFERFYEEAYTRDAEMVENLIQIMERAQEHPSPTLEGVSAGRRWRPFGTGRIGPKGGPKDRVRGGMILVTGGFHAAGMERLLTRAGFTVVTYVPKIEKVDTPQGSAYLSVFTREKTPLEKLFAGEKLFLGMRLLLGVIQGVGAVGVVAVMEMENPNTPYEQAGETFQTLVGDAEHVVIGSHDEGLHQAVVMVDGGSYLYAMKPGGLYGVETSSVVGVFILGVLISRGMGVLRKWLSNGVEFLRGVMNRVAGWLSGRFHWVKLIFGTAVFWGVDWWTKSWAVGMAPEGFVRRALADGHEGFWGWVDYSRGVEGPWVELWRGIGIQPAFHDVLGEGVIGLLVVSILFSVYVWGYRFDFRNFKWRHSLLFGGVLGNLIDLWRMGGVWNFLPTPTAIFNLADIFILMGMAWILLSWRSKGVPVPPGRMVNANNEVIRRLLLFSYWFHFAVIFKVYSLVVDIVVRGVMMIIGLVMMMMGLFFHQEPYLWEAHQYPFQFGATRQVDTSSGKKGYLFRGYAGDTGDGSPFFPSIAKNSRIFGYAEKIGGHPKDRVYGIPIGAHQTFGALADMLPSHHFMGLYLTLGVDKKANRWENPEAVQFEWSDNFSSPKAAVLGVHFLNWAYSAMSPFFMPLDMPEDIRRGLERVRVDKSLPPAWRLIDWQIRRAKIFVGKIPVYLIRPPQGTRREHVINFHIVPRHDLVKTDEPENPKRDLRARPRLDSVEKKFRVWEKGGENPSESIGKPAMKILNNHSDFEFTNEDVEAARAEFLSLIDKELVSIRARAGRGGPGGHLLFLGDFKDAWWKETWGLVGLGAVIVVLGGVLSVWGVDVSGLPEFAALALRGDLAVLLKTVWGAFVGLHVAEYLWHRIWKSGRGPPTWNMGWSLLIAALNLLLVGLDWSPVALLAVAISWAFLSHFLVNRYGVRWWEVRPADFWRRVRVSTSHSEAVPMNRRRFLELAMKAGLLTLAACSPIRMVPEPEPESVETPRVFSEGLPGFREVALEDVTHPETREYLREKGILTERLEKLVSIQIVDQETYEKTIEVPHNPDANALIGEVHTKDTLSSDGSAEGDRKIELLFKGKPYVMLFYREGDVLGSLVGQSCVAHEWGHVRQFESGEWPRERALVEGRKAYLDRLFEQEIFKGVHLDFLRWLGVKYEDLARVFNVVPAGMTTSEALAVLGKRGETIPQANWWKEAGLDDVDPVKEVGWERLEQDSSFKINLKIKQGNPAAVVLIYHPLFLIPVTIQYLEWEAADSPEIKRGVELDLFRGSATVQGNFTDWKRFKTPKDLGEIFQEQLRATLPQVVVPWQRQLLIGAVDQLDGLVKRVGGSADAALVSAGIAGMVLTNETPFEGLMKEYFPHFGTNQGAPLEEGDRIWDWEKMRMGRVVRKQGDEGYMVQGDGENVSLYRRRNDLEKVEMGKESAWSEGSHRLLIRLSGLAKEEAPWFTVKDLVTLSYRFAKEHSSNQGRNKLGFFTDLAEGKLPGRKAIELALQCAAKNGSAKASWGLNLFGINSCEREIILRANAFKDTKIKAKDVFVLLKKMWGEEKFWTEETLKRAVEDELKWAGTAIVWNEGYIGNAEEIKKRVRERVLEGFLSIGSMAHKLARDTKSGLNSFISDPMTDEELAQSVDRLRGSLSYEKTKPEVTLQNLEREVKDRLKKQMDLILRLLFRAYWRKGILLTPHLIQNGKMGGLPDIRFALNFLHPGVEIQQAVEDYYRASSIPFGEVDGSQFTLDAVGGVKWKSRMGSPALLPPLDLEDIELDDREIYTSKIFNHPEHVEGLKSHGDYAKNFAKLKVIAYRHIVVEQKGLGHEGDSKGTSFVNPNSLHYIRHGEPGAGLAWGAVEAAVLGAVSWVMAFWSPWLPVVIPVAMGLAHYFGGYRYAVSTGRIQLSRKETAFRSIVHGLVALPYAFSGMGGLTLLLASLFHFVFDAVVILKSHGDEFQDGLARGVAWLAIRSPQAAGFIQGRLETMRRAYPGFPARFFVQLVGLKPSLDRSPQVKALLEEGSEEEKLLADIEKADDREKGGILIDFFNLIAGSRLEVGLRDRIIERLAGLIVSERMVARALKSNLSIHFAQDKDFVWDVLIRTVELRPDIEGVWDIRALFVELFKWGRPDFYNDTFILALIKWPGFEVIPGAVTYVDVWAEGKRRSLTSPLITTTEERGVLTDISEFLFRIGSESVLAGNKKRRELKTKLIKMAELEASPFRALWDMASLWSSLELAPKRHASLDSLGRYLEGFRRGRPSHKLLEMHIDSPEIHPVVRIACLLLLYQDGSYEPGEFSEVYRDILAEFPGLGALFSERNILRAAWRLGNGEESSIARLLTEIKLSPKTGEWTKIVPFKKPAKRKFQAKHLAQDLQELFVESLSTSKYHNALTVQAGIILKVMGEDSITLILRSFDEVLKKMDRSRAYLFRDIVSAAARLVWSGGESVLPSAGDTAEEFPVAVVSEGELLEVQKEALHRPEGFIPPNSLLYILTGNPWLGAAGGIGEAVGLFHLTTWMMAFAPWLLWVVPVGMTVAHGAAYLWMERGINYPSKVVNITASSLVHGLAALPYAVVGIGVITPDIAAIIHGIGDIVLLALVMIANVEEEIKEEKKQYLVGLAGSQALDVGEVLGAMSLQYSDPLTPDTAAKILSNLMESVPLRLGLNNEERIDTHGGGSVGFVNALIEYSLKYKGISGYWSALRDKLNNTGVRTQGQELENALTPPVLGSRVFFVAKEDWGNRREFIEEVSRLVENGYFTRDNLVIVSDVSKEQWGDLAGFVYDGMRRDAEAGFLWTDEFKDYLARFPSIGGRGWVLGKSESVVVTAPDGYGQVMNWTKFIRQMKNLRDFIASIRPRSGVESGVAEVGLQVRVVDLQG